MRLRTRLHAIAHPRTLIFGLALGLALALPARALGQDGASAPPADQTPTDVPPVADAPATADAAEAEDPAAAGDVELTTEQVRELQDGLKDLGYYYGPSDGRKGPRTRTAVRNFQRDQRLAVTGSFDSMTVARIGGQARTAQTMNEPVTSTPPPAAPAAHPSSTVAPEAHTGSSGSGGLVGRARTVGGSVVGGVKTGVGAITTGGRAVGMAGEKTGDAAATAGKETGDAATTAGKETAKAGVITADASVTAGKAVANAGMLVYNGGRRLIVGDHKDKEHSDDDIRKAIEREYADEDRIVPGEIDVRVTHGDVTLALPDGARSDVAHAVRLAKLTPGVRSVTTITTTVDQSGAAQPPTQQ
jgi:peptidoglycan hydrolase-like protein with peptidoglycan-binding domain